MGRFIPVEASGRLAQGVLGQGGLGQQGQGFHPRHVHVTAQAVMAPPVEGQHRGGGPGQAGDKISLVDASYAPFLQRFAFVEAKLKTDILKDFPLLQAWSDALLGTDIVTGSVADSFEDEFVASLKRREFYVGTLFEEQSAAAE